MRLRSVIVVVMSLLVIALVYSPSSSFYVFAVPPDPKFGSAADCKGDPDPHLPDKKTCCWYEDTGVDSVVERYCQTCYGNPPVTCNGKEKQIVGGEGIVAPPPSGVAPPPPPGPGQGGPGNVLPEGIFEGPTTPPPQQKMTPEMTPLPPTCPPGQELDEDTNLCFRVPQEQEEQQQQSEVTEEEQAVPVCQEGLEFNEDLGFCVPTECPEGQELDEGSGLCVLEQPEVAEEQPEVTQEEPEQQQSSDGGDSSDDNSIGNNDGDNNNNN